MKCEFGNCQCEATGRVIIPNVKKIEDGKINIKFYCTKHINKEVDLPKEKLAISNSDLMYLSYGRRC